MKPFANHAFIPSTDCQWSGEASSSPIAVIYSFFLPCAHANYLGVSCLYPTRSVRSVVWYNILIWHAIHTHTHTHTIQKEKGLK